MTTIDKYTLGARVYPVIVIMLVPVTSMFFFMDLDVKNLMSFLPLTALLALAALFAALTRSSGKKIETQLFDQWGGKPTTLLLLYETSTFNKTILDGIRKKIESICDGVKFLDENQELLDKKKAREICEYATLQLIQKTRDETKFNLVLRENISYGFFRNLYAIRKYEIFMNLCVLTYLFCICLHGERVHISNAEIYISILNMAAILFFEINNC